jgi:toxin FitB
VNYLIDTNVISEIGKGGRCNANVAAWYVSIEATEIYLSVLVLGEIRKGVERARVPNLERATKLEAWLSRVREAFTGRILVVDEAVADEWGRMSAKRPLPGADGLLAATAKVHGLTLVTRNTKDVADLGADILDPFEARLSGGQAG